MGLGGLESSDQGNHPSVWSAIIRHLIVIGGYLLAWTSLDFLAIKFEAAPGVSIWYPPSALDIALLLVFGMRYWAILLLNTLIHVILTGNAASLLGLNLVFFDAATTAGYAGGAYILARVLRIDPGLRQGRDVLWFVVTAVVGAPLFVATLQVSNLTVMGNLRVLDLPLNILRHFAGDATGVAMLAPILLVLARRLPHTLAHQAASGVHPRRAALGKPPWRSIRLLIAEAIGFVAAVWAAYGWQRPSTLDYSFFAWIPMIWTALRYGFERAAAFALAVNLAIVLLVSVRSSGESPYALQFGLLTLTVTALVLGAYATDRLQATQQLRHQALHDHLTGLPNRVLFRTRLDQAIAARRAAGAAFLIAILDLDDFKGVNDTLGHGSGDALLMTVGQRLQQVAAPGSVVARLGGDEFGLLLHLPDPARAGAMLDGLLDHLAEPFALDGHVQRLRGSIGATIPTGGDAGADDLVGQADLALNAAKAAGRARYCFYTPEMQDRLRIRLRMAEELEQALGRRELVLHFQPQVCCTTRRIVAAEALVRWMHPVRGLLLPGDFLEFVELAGLMAQLGGWVLHEACIQAAAWPGSIAVSVNVAPAQWRTGHDLAAEVEQALAESGLPPGRLKLEITEDALVQGEEARSFPALARLRAQGVRVSMDDFGTGHSGLSRLQRLPVDEVKLDQSFVTGIGRSAGDEAIARTVASLARSLGHQVVAEGVETEAQFAFLRDIGCGLAQGYLFSPPLAPDAFAALLATEPAGPGPGA